MYFAKIQPEWYVKKSPGKTSNGRNGVTSISFGICHKFFRHCLVTLRPSILHGRDVSVCKLQSSTVKPKFSACKLVNSHYLNNFKRELHDQHSLAKRMFCCNLNQVSWYFECQESVMFQFQYFSCAINIFSCVPQCHVVCWHGGVQQIAYEVQQVAYEDSLKP